MFFNINFVNFSCFVFFFQAEDGIRDADVTGVQTCALPIFGTRRSNKRKGGGTSKGPKPRDYEFHLPKNAVRAATRMAILSKFQDEQAVIIDELNLKEVQTKQVAGILKALKLDRTTCLIGLADRDPVVYKSARNI